MKKVIRFFPIALAFVLVVALIPPDVLAKGGGGFSGGGRSYSSPSRSYSSPSPSRSYSAPSMPSTRSPSRSFSTPSVPSSPPKQSVTPPKTDYNSGAGRALERTQSQKKFESTQPKTDANDYSRQRIKDLRHDLSYERMQNRELRNRQTFGRYYGQTTVYRYNDGFNVFFWLWLLDRPRNDRDMWVYNHRDEMDRARYEALLQKDTNLEQRLKELEAQGVKKDPSYVPAGVDRDLMYNDEQVKKIYEESRKPSFPWGWSIFIILFVAVVIVFFVRFKVRRD